MSYVTPADLVGRFGAEEIAQAADRGTPRRLTSELLALAIAGDALAGWAAADEAAAAAAMAAISTAIADAQSLLDGYLAGRYATPLATPPLFLQRATANVARRYLHGDAASEAVVQAAEAAVALGRDIAAGKVKLGDGEQAMTRPAGSVTLASSERRFGRVERGL